MADPMPTVAEYAATMANLGPPVPNPPAPVTNPPAPVINPPASVNPPAPVANANPSIIDRMSDGVFEFSCKIHRLFFKLLFSGIFLVGHVLLRLQYSLGLALYFIRGHDNSIIHNSPPFLAIGKPNMKLKSRVVGPSRSCLADMYASQGPDIPPQIPKLSWTLPQNTNINSMPKEYALVCEDPDWPVPGKARLHCLLYNIRPTYRQLRPRDIRPSLTMPFCTATGLGYVNIKPHGPYCPPDPLFGHGEHRYIFTIIALKEAVQFIAPDRVTKDDFIDEINGKVVGYGQWECRYGRAWPAF